MPTKKPTVQKPAPSRKMKRRETEASGVLSRTTLANGRVQELKAKIPASPAVTNHSLRRFYNIHITDKIIEAATRRDSSHCAIANAIRADHPDLLRPMVDLATVRFTDAKTGVRYICFTPRIAQQFLVNFDAGDRAGIKPFWTQLRVAQALPPPDPEHAKRQAESKRARDAKAKAEPKAPVKRKGKPSGGAGGGTPLEVRHTRGSNTGDCPAPALVGGRALPTSRFAKMRRFGLRGLKA